MNSSPIKDAIWITGCFGGMWVEDQKKACVFDFTRIRGRGDDGLDMVAFFCACRN